MSVLTMKRLLESAKYHFGSLYELEIYIRISSDKASYRIIGIEYKNIIVEVFTDSDSWLVFINS